MKTVLIAMSLFCGLNSYAETINKHPAIEDQVIGSLRSAEIVTSAPREWLTISQCMEISKGIISADLAKTSGLNELVRVTFEDGSSFLGSTVFFEKEPESSRHKRESIGEIKTKLAIFYRENCEKLINKADTYLAFGANEKECSEKNVSNRTPKATGLIFSDEKLQRAISSQAISK